MPYTPRSAKQKSFEPASFIEALGADLDRFSQKPNPFEVYFGRPIEFAREVLRMDLTPSQEEILTSIVANRRTCVKASHAVGKTVCAAIAAVYWYYTQTESIVYITAPSWHQCINLCFKWITKLIRDNNLPNADILQTGLVRDCNVNRTGTHYIRALNAADGEKFQGEHAAPILLLLEEAVGVPSYIWEAGDGLLTDPRCRLLAIANPTTKSCSFADVCDQTGVNVITICAFNHPNIQAQVEGDPKPFEGAVDLLWLQEMIAKECVATEHLHGEAFEFPPNSGTYYLPNAIFQGRVLGEFPTAADSSVIPAGYLRDLPILPANDDLAIGVDVARMGDDRSTIAGRAGSCLVELQELRKMDVDVVAAAARDCADRMGAAWHINPKSIPIRVDVTGGLGVAPAVMLTQQGYSVEEVNVSSNKSYEPDKYDSIRSELWFALADRARTKDLDLSRIDPELRKALIKELTTPTWAPDIRGRKRVEPKKDMKRRLKWSPDLADAVNMAFWGSSANWHDWPADYDTGRQMDLLQTFGAPLSTPTGSAVDTPFDLVGANIATDTGQRRFDW